MKYSYLTLAITALGFSFSAFSQYAYQEVIPGQTVVVEQPTIVKCAGAAAPVPTGPIYDAEYLTSLSNMELFQHATEYNIGDQVYCRIEKSIYRTGFANNYYKTAYQITKRSKGSRGYRRLSRTEYFETDKPIEDSLRDVELRKKVRRAQDDLGFKLRDLIMDGTCKP